MPFVLERLCLGREVVDVEPRLCRKKGVIRFRACRTPGRWAGATRGELRSSPSEYALPTNCADAAAAIGIETYVSHPASAISASRPRVCRHRPALRWRAAPVRPYPALWSGRARAQGSGTSGKRSVNRWIRRPSRARSRAQSSMKSQPDQGPGLGPASAPRRSGSSIGARPSSPVEGPLVDVHADEPVRQIMSVRGRSARRARAPVTAARARRRCCRATGPKAAAGSPHRPCPGGPRCYPAAGKTPGELVPPDPRSRMLTRPWVVGQLATRGSPGPRRPCRRHDVEDSSNGVSTGSARWPTASCSSGTHWSRRRAPRRAATAAGPGRAWSATTMAYFCP